MEPRDIIAAMLRGIHLAALISAFGTLLFRLVIARDATTDVEPAIRHRLQDRLHRLAEISLASALGAGVAWLFVEAGTIAGANTFVETAHALPTVALYTQFGQTLLSRCALLVVALTLLWLRRAGAFAACLLCGLALILQPWLGHAGAVGGTSGLSLTVSEGLHLLAAGAWLGGLLPLFISVRSLPHAAAAAACRNFTPIGLSAVLILAGTAIVQFAFFIGDIPALFGTRYGEVGLLKLALFVILLALAALNRLVLTGRLDGASADRALRHMQRSVAAEAMLGVCVVAAAAFLASQTPGIHEQPVWPFAWRLSLDALAEPELRNEVVLALIGVASAIILLLVAVFSRRLRWLSVGLGIVVLAASLPHLDLLLVPAYETSYFTSPTEFAATAIVHGAGLFAARCTSCHGQDGRGDGPAAASLPVKPADLLAEHLWAHQDGEMFWYISHGFAAPDGSTSMPGFADLISIEGRWDLIDYLRARNAGAARRQSGAWSHPIQLPQFDARCADGRMIDLDDMRGRVVLIQTDQSAEPVAEPDVIRILLTRDGGAPSANGACIATEPEAWSAFAIILGIPSTALSGVSIVADRNAWLRAAWWPSEDTRLAEPKALAALLRDIAEHPLQLATTGGHVHTQPR